MKLYSFAGELDGKIVSVKRDGAPEHGHVTLHLLVGSEARILVVPSTEGERMGERVMLRLLKEQVLPLMPEVKAVEFSDFWQMCCKLVW